MIRTQLPLLLTLILMSILSCFCNQQNKVLERPEVLLVTGGHSFDTTRFFGMWFSFGNMKVDTISQTQANNLLETDKVDKYDVIVYYDMWQDITDGQKKAFLKLLEKGTGIVFMHHSIVSYQEWPEFINVTGGKYHQPGFEKDSSKLSGFQHDLDFQVLVLDKDHPVTKDLENFQIHDEGYSNVEILPSVYPLLKVNHPSCSEYVAWTNEYGNSRIVYIMLGHDKYAYQNESFMKLCQNAVLWVSR